MNSQYLNEAFKKLDLLEEEAFNLSDIDAFEKLKDFTKAAEDEADTTIEVVDAEADTEADLKDSYLGKVIIDCEVCHTKQFKDPDEIVMEEGEDLVNLEEECPYCFSMDGFNIVGQVAPYKAEDEEEAEEEAEEPEVEIDGEEAEIDAEANDELEADDEGEDKEEVKESLKEGYMGQTLDDFLQDWNTEGDIAIWCHDMNEDGPIFEGDFSDIPQNLLNAQFDDFDTDGKIYVSISDVDEDDDDEDMDESLNESSNWDKVKAALDRMDAAKDGDLEESVHEDGHFYTDSRDAQILDDAFCYLRDLMPNDAEFAKFAKDHLDMTDEELMQYCDIEVAADDELGEALEEGVAEAEAIDEAFEEVSIKTEDAEMEMTQDPESGEVNVRMVPIDEAAEDADDEEQFAPIDNDKAAEILAADDSSDLDIEEIADKVDEIKAEEAAEEAEEEAEDKEEDDDMVDFEVEDFDEDSFDKLGESYLKEVYDNVESFKTTGVNLSDNNLIIEGIISFNSGNDKKTSFIFEAKEATKRGRVRFIGENAQITKGKKAFKLSGSVQDNRLISESLNYNYRAKNPAGKSVRLYGTIK